MNPKTPTPQVWSTASFGDPATTSNLELLALKSHLTLCQGRSGRLFSLRCKAERMRCFVASRRITALLGSVLLVLAATWVL